MLAAYFKRRAKGLAVQARDGASREKLAEIGRLAMRAWHETKGGETTKTREIKARARRAQLPRDDCPDFGRTPSRSRH